MEGGRSKIEDGAPTYREFSFLGEGRPKFRAQNSEVALYKLLDAPHLKADISLSTSLIHCPGFLDTYIPFTYHLPSHIGQMRIIPRQIWMETRGPQRCIGNCARSSGAEQAAVPDPVHLSFAQGPPRRPSFANLRANLSIVSLASQ